MTATIQHSRSTSARSARRRARAITVTAATAAASAVWIITKLVGTTPTVSMPHVRRTAHA